MNKEIMDKSEKIRTNFAKIIVSGTCEKPYYEIMYFDHPKNEMCIGYSSYNLKYVFQWLEDIFEVVVEETERRNGKMKLKDTIEMMNSEDYKERFKAEYWQTKIRYEKLHKMCIKYEAGTLNFTPSCSLELLKEQKMHMGMYLHALEVRAEIEKIDLHE